MLARTVAFSPEQDETLVHEVPAAAAVFALHGDGDPYVSKTANLRRRLLRLLGHPTELSRRLNLRDRVRRIEFTLTGSDFESQFLLYKLMRELFPKKYAARLRLRPAPLLKLHFENEYPRASVTTRPSLRGKNLYYGPFPSRLAAEKFASDALDFFKMRRCVEDLSPDPAFPGCVYSEMKMCLAPCFKGCTDAEYHAEVARVQNFLDTRGESLVRQLAGQREQASAELAFEQAAALHAKVEKLKPVLAHLPEIVRRIDQLDLAIVQPSAVPDSVNLFRFRALQLTGPLPFSVAGSQPVEINSGEGQRLPARTMDSRIEGAFQSFPALQPRPTVELIEHLAILKRWYFRSHRIGEVFFADEKGSWPLRRIARGIARVYRGEHQQDDSSVFSATRREIASS